MHSILKTAFGKRLAIVIGLGACWLTTGAHADHPISPHGIRTGGALEQSYQYHRQLPYAPLADVPRYSYGFPAPSYNWGWFGARHYYPRSTFHRGYNGDYWQWAYRRGY